MDWYHGEIAREYASRLLNGYNNTRQDGFFLIRDNTKKKGDFSLSLWKAGNILHFQINCLGDNKFVIDDGPIFQGLDSLVRHYQSDSDGLPCKLSSVYCKGQTPPLSALKYGVDTELHRACSNKNILQVKQLLHDRNSLLDINGRNRDGLTPLHIACSHPHDPIVSMLLKAKADTTVADAGGRTPMQILCANGYVSTLKLLIEEGDADIHERSPLTFWVPLHEVALRGHLDCVKLLLSHNAAIHPRTVDGDTPKDLALRSGKDNIVEYFDNYPVPAPKTTPSQWLHQDVDRSTAAQILQQSSRQDGSFLIRSSIKTRGYFVLSLYYEEKVYNFQIKNRADRYFYIDDGPLFETLPHLVDHYMQYADGLPTKLKKPVPSKTRRPLQPNVPPRPKPSPPLRLPDTPGKPAPTPLQDRTPVSHDDDVGGFAKLSKSLNPSVPSPMPAVHVSVKKSPLPPLPKSSAKIPNLSQQTMIHNDAIKVDDVLGQGEFGEVCKGIWTDPSGEKVPVALKMLHQDRLQQGKEEFLREARVMSHLNHPCIVRLLGVCLGPPMILVQELVSMGALLDYLIDFQPQIREVDLKLWAAQIAWGMMYLEQKRFVHRDLATRNILLASKTQCKISDFGLSRAVGAGSDYYQAKQGGRWPVKWYAPESINYGTFSQKSDVWSYGVTLWEMFTFGQLPYGEMTGGQVIQFLETGGRLEQPDDCPRHTYNIMLQCWEKEAVNRPTFKKLHEIFSTDPEYADARKIREMLRK